MRFPKLDIKVAPPAKEYHSESKTKVSVFNIKSCQYTTKTELHIPHIPRALTVARLSITCPCVGGEGQSQRSKTSFIPSKHTINIFFSIFD